MRHARFVGHVGCIIDGANAQHMALGLKRPPELAGALRRPAGHDDGLDGGIGEDFFQITNAARLQAPALQILPAECRPAVNGQLMLA